MNDLEKTKKAVEAIVFISGDGIELSDIAKGLSKTNQEIKIILDSLIDDYQERDGGIFLNQGGSKYFFSTDKKVFTSIQYFLKENKKETLSKAMLETLAIIAYKQPLTLFDIEEVRGVNSRAVVTVLISKKLIKQVGQKESPGKPGLYGTTKEFLEYFGLQDLKELPPLKEVKEINFEEI
ncbi:MAG: SMC-Scp complex subunit ScpB [Spirochaetia bacterium]|nr:SMC-Scp complex subunit ScpB [Spirochaetia bacterium]